MRTRRLQLVGLLALGLSGVWFSQSALSQIHLPFSKGPKSDTAPAPAPASSSTTSSAPVPSSPTPAPKPAPTQPVATAGSFDFYLLSLAWAPEFCSQPGEAERSPAECAAGKNISFMVHGLWPEANQGPNPESCEPARNVPKTVPKPVINLILDYMLSPSLIQHEWTTHGVCAGKTPSDYFTDVLQARAAVQLPVEFTSLDQPAKESPAQIEAQFERSNNLFPKEAFRTACRHGALTEVRICFNKGPKVQACPARLEECTTPSLTILPLR